MSKYIITPIILVCFACNVDSSEKSTNTDNSIVDTQQTTESTIDAASAQKEEEVVADTFCYVLTEGEKNKNINAARIVFLPKNKITGELKYITQGQPAAAGKLNGTIKDNIITADWTFIKNDTNFYSVPVAFKVTKNAIYQKPPKVDDKGKPYIPEDGEYSFEFKKVGCEYYPQ